MMESETLRQLQEALTSSSQGNRRARAPISDEELGRLIQETIKLLTPKRVTPEEIEKVQANARQEVTLLLQELGLNPDKFISG